MLMVVGLAVGSATPGASSLLTGTGYALMMALFTIMLADRAFRFGTPVIWSLGIVRAVLGAGRLVGASLALYIQEIPSHDSFVAIGVMLAVLVASIMWMQDSYSVTRDCLVMDGEAEVASDEGKGDAGDSSQAGEAADIDASALKRHLLQRCKEVGEEYHLSKREMEVFECLAFGWSVARIEEKLVISNSTAKTHVRHIYSKLGIHSRDELKMLLGVDVF